MYVAQMNILKGQQMSNCHLKRHINAKIRFYAMTAKESKVQKQSSCVR